MIYINFIVVVFHYREGKKPLYHLQWMTRLRFVKKSKNVPLLSLGTKYLVNPMTVFFSDNLSIRLCFY